MDHGAPVAMPAGSGVDRRRVVVTGMGAVSPLGCSADALWAGLIAGRSGVAAQPDLDVSACRTRIAARVAGYTPSEHFSAKQLKRLNLTSQLALVAAAEAVRHAGLDVERCDPAGVGVVLGSATGGFQAIEPTLRSFWTEGTITDPLTVPLLMNSAPASNVSIHFGFRGPLLTVDAACASSAHAIGYALNLIRSGVVPIVLTGGADSSVCAPLLHAWSGLRVLSQRNDTPAEACRPFSLDRDGIVLGEGAGILVLESEASALNRGARILAEITGYAATSDGHRLTLSSVAGIQGSMRLALADAALTVDQIDYINAHGTGTEWNDKIETAAIKAVFGGRSYEIPVVGVKAAIGHSIAASGALEMISCVFSIRDGVVPPTLNLKVPDPECDLDYVPEGARPCDIRHAMSNSFAFGGSNAVLIVSRYAS